MIIWCNVTAGAGKGGKSTTKIIIIIVSSLAGVFVSVLVGFLYYSSLVRKRKQKGILTLFFRPYNNIIDFPQSLNILNTQMKEKVKRFY